MRICPFEYSAWILFLAFPMDYQTDHYINKAVSCFAKLDLWHMPGQNKERVLVRVLISDIAQVPHSLVVRRVGTLLGIGRSWTVPVYILNGRHTIPNLAGNEDQLPPMGASPHPFDLPYLSAAQQWLVEQQEMHQQQINEAWEQNVQQEPAAQNDGWGVWLEVEPAFNGVNLREILQYDGPSLCLMVLPLKAMFLMTRKVNGQSTLMFPQRTIWSMVGKLLQMA